MTRARSLSRLANSSVFTVSDTNRVGIGSTIPDAKLDVTGNIEVAGIITAAAGAAVTYYGDGSGLTGVASTDYIITGTAATFNNQVTIQNLYVGAATTIQGTLSYEDVTNVDSIGIITARKTLRVLNASPTIPSSGTGLEIYYASGTFNDTPSAYMISYDRTSSAHKPFTVDASEYRFKGSGTDRLRITSSGNVGINTVAPTGQLEVRGNDGLNISNNTRIGTDGAQWRLIPHNGVGSKTNLRLYEGAGATEVLNITKTGNIGIGTTNPTALLTIAANSASAELALKRTNTNTVGAVGAINWQALDGHSVASMYALGDGDDEGAHLILATTSAASADDPYGIGERLRIGSAGQIGLGGANYGTAGQVLTSNGSGSAVTWEDASGGGITTEAATPSNAVTQINLTNATDHKVTATGICTITTTTAGTEGQSHTIRIVNSGIATVGFSTYFLFPSGSAPSLPTADGAISIISFTVHDSVGAGCTQLLAGASLNFS